MSSRLAEPLRVLAEPDPVAAFLDAHTRDVDVVLASSGSSGAARAVRRSTHSWVDSFDSVAGLCGLEAGSRVWVPGPPSATMNLFAAVLAQWLGAVRVDSAADATHAFVTPTTLRSRVGELRGRTVVVAGDRLSPALAQEATSGSARVHHYYGAAELSFVAWGDHADDLRPFPGVDVQVRDGEVWVRSPYLCRGYVGPPGPLRTDAAGYATVGDRGELVEGRLVVGGRPDAVTTGGATVLVADVEAALAPQVRGDVVVVGVPHAHLGQVLAAVMTTEDDLVRGRAVPLSSAHRPRLWYILEELPTTAAGKVDRRAVAEAVLGRSPSVQA